MDQNQHPQDDSGRTAWFDICRARASSLRQRCIDQVFQGYLRGRAYPGSGRRFAFHQLHLEQTLSRRQANLPGQGFLLPGLPIEPCERRWRHHRRMRRSWKQNNAPGRHLASTPRRRSAGHCLRKGPFPIQDSAEDDEARRPRRYHQSQGRTELPQTWSQFEGVQQRHWLGA